MNLNKYLFLDRDGTLIIEPENNQVDSLEKLALVDGVIPALLRLAALGFRFVIVTNQDGLGTPSFPTASFDIVQNATLRLFSSQGIVFDDILVCPHFASDSCTCRKPNLGLFGKYLERGFSRFDSFVIGDRESDLELAKNLGIGGIRIGVGGSTWRQIADRLTAKPRVGTYHRTSSETDVKVEVNLDEPGEIAVDTGIVFFDHMLSQLAKHGDFSLSVLVKGDLQVDEHHTVEDSAIGIGSALRQAIGDKIGIGRYGFSLPMDEAEAKALIDLCGRTFCKFSGEFTREYVGRMPTELVPHFFRSLADALGATLHLDVQGDNNHHMIEALFKATGRSLKAALARTANGALPSTKGIL